MHQQQNLEQMLKMAHSHIVQIIHQVDIQDITVLKVQLIGLYGMEQVQITQIDGIIQHLEVGY